MRALLAASFARLLTLLRVMGPYAAIELLLPGGTLIALFYWWYRRSVLVRAATHPSGKAPQLQSRSGHRWWDGNSERVTPPEARPQCAQSSTAVRRSTTTRVATAIVVVLACLSTACT